MLSTYRVYSYAHPDSPAITAGSGAALIGAQSGLFPDMGYTVPGEMGGLWAGGMKVCDGFFLAIDDVPLRESDAYEAHPVAPAFHYRMQEQGLHVVRRQFIPDGVDGCVIELTIENLKNAPRMAEVSFTVRTDILTVAAARGEDGLELGRDVGEYDEKTQAFYARDSRNPWHAVWGADKKSRVLSADLPQDIYGFGNTQGKGVNGRLFYRMRLGALAQGTMRLFIAGGFASRSKAEDALALLRERAETMLGEKEARVAGLMRMSEAKLPGAELTQCFNWAKIYADWLTRTLPRGGCALCVDLPENPSLYGEGWAEAIGGLLPLGGAKTAQEILRTLVRLSEDAQLAPGRLARSVSMAGRVLQVGGPKESAQFVRIVQETLRWSGDLDFAREMLPMTGLCVNHLRRSTRSFTDVRADIVKDVRLALRAQAELLRMTGADDAACLAELAKLPPEEPQAPAANASLAEAALWHGAQGHVEQMVGCLSALAQAGLPGMPGAQRGQNAAQGVLLESRAIAGFVWPMIRYLFGLTPDAAQKRIDWHPHTPIGWDGWKLERLMLGGAEAMVVSERISPSKARYTLRLSEPGWVVRVMQDGEARELPVDGELSLVMED